MSRQSLVLDANILIRAVLGQRVFTLLNQHHNTTAFFAPDEAFADEDQDFFGSGVATWTPGTVTVYLAGGE